MAVSLGDWVAPSSDVEGLLAAAGDVSLARYSVGEIWFTPPHVRSEYVAARLPAGYDLPPAGIFPEEWELAWSQADGLINPNATFSRRSDLAVGGKLNFTSGAVLSGGNAFFGRGGSEQIGYPRASVN